MIDNIKDIYDNYSSNADDKISTIVTEKSVHKKLWEMEEWTSPVIYTED